MDTNELLFLTNSAYKNEKSIEHAILDLYFNIIKGIEEH